MKTTNKLTAFATTVGLSVLLFTSRASAGWAEDVFGTSILKNGKIDIDSLIALVFRFLLGIALLWVVFNIVMAGLKIAGAKEDADKRKEGLKAIVNAAIGLAVALLAYAIANTVRNIVNPDAQLGVGAPCGGYLASDPGKTQGFRSGFYVKQAAATNETVSDPNNPAQQIGIKIGDLICREGGLATGAVITPGDR